MHCRPGDAACRHYRQSAFRVVVLALCAAHGPAMARARGQETRAPVGRYHSENSAVGPQRQPLPGCRERAQYLSDATHVLRPSRRARGYGRLAFQSVASQSRHHAQHAPMGVGQLELGQDLGLGFPHDRHVCRPPGRAPESRRCLAAASAHQHLSRQRT